MLVEGLPPLSPRLRARQPERFPAEVERHFRLVRRALSLHRTFLQVSADGFARAAAAAAAPGLPTVITQEGGYAVDALGRLLGRFLAGWGG